MVDFVEFAGTAERRGDIVRLTAQNDNGSLEFAIADVRLDALRPQVRRGATALALEEPRRGNVADRPSAEAFRDVCPNGITACIGTVHVCCENFRVIGSCIGAWGCAPRPFIP